MRKLITNHRGKVANVKDYVRMVRGLTARRLPTAEDLPAELLGDPTLIGAALREEEYTGPVITKDVMDFIAGFLDGVGGVTYGYNDTSMAEWIAAKVPGVKVVYPSGGMKRHLAAPPEISKLDVANKWLPLCPPFPTGEAVPQRLRHKVMPDEPHKIPAHSQIILPLSGGHALNVAKTIMARDIAIMCSGNEGRVRAYTFFMDERNTLNIPVLDLENKDVSTNAINSLGKMVTDIAKELCLKNPINGARDYLLQEVRAAGCVQAGGNKTMMALTVRLSIRSVGVAVNTSRVLHLTPEVGIEESASRGIATGSTLLNFPIQSAAASLRTSLLQVESDRRPHAGPPQVPIRSAAGLAASLLGGMGSVFSGQQPWPGTSQRPAGDIVQYCINAMHGTISPQRYEAAYVRLGTALRQYIIERAEGNPEAWNLDRINSAYQTLHDLMAASGMMGAGYVRNSQLEAEVLDSMQSIM